jgi:glutathione peroxidase-family protein
LAKPIRRRGALQSNCTRFLVDGSSRVVERCAPDTKQDAIEQDIEKRL